MHWCSWRHQHILFLSQLRSALKLILNSYSLGRHLRILYIILPIPHTLIYTCSWGYPYSTLCLPPILTHPYLNMGASSCALPGRKWRHFSRSRDRETKRKHVSNYLPNNMSTQLCMSLILNRYLCLCDLCVCDFDCLRVCDCFSLMFLFVLKTVSSVGVWQCYCVRQIYASLERVQSELPMSEQRIPNCLLLSPRQRTPAINDVRERSYVLT